MFRQSRGLTKRAPDAGDSAAISGSFLRLSIFPWTVRPGQAGWTASPSLPQRRYPQGKPQTVSRLD